MTDPKQNRQNEERDDNKPTGQPTSDRHKTETAERSETDPIEKDD